MALHRLTSITLGVPDPTLSSAFLQGFGLDQHDDLWFGTRDGGKQVELVQSPVRQLQRLGVGASDGDDLGRIAARVSELDFGTVIEHSEDRLVIAEPVTGLPVEVTVAEPYSSDASDSAVNGPGGAGRMNVPADSVMNPGPVKPANLSHVVYGSPDQPETVRFFTEVMGFEISDAVDGIVAFARCGEVHHNLAIQAAPVAYPHHLAFEVDSVDDVVRGGQHMVNEDPGRHMWGVGRHAIGSNWFWYLRDPSGVLVEYAADIDRISEQDLYKPKEWEGQEILYSYGPEVPFEFIEPSDLNDLIAASA